MPSAHRKAKCEVQAPICVSRQIEWADRPDEAWRSKDGGLAAKLWPYGPVAFHEVFEAGQLLCPDRDWRGAVPDWSAT